MINDTGLVVGVDHIQEIIDYSINNINKHHANLLKEKKIIIEKCDGRNGCSEYGPYDCIHVGAAAAELPQALIDQLANGGRLVIPVGEPGENQYIYVIDKDKDGKISKRKELCVSYVPLTSVEKQLKGF